MKPNPKQKNEIPESHPAALDPLYHHAVRREAEKKKKEFMKLFVESLEKKPKPTQE